MNVTADISNEAGIRKAAILVASLDQLSADVLLEQLDRREADMVRQCLIDLPDVDDEERCRVIEEFRRIGPMLPDDSPPGIELTGLSLRRYETNDVTDDPLDESRPFGFLHETEDEKLQCLLADERPQTIALVLSHLPADRAGGVLDRLSSEVQVEVVRRLVDLENTDPVTLCEIQRALAERLSRLVDLDRRRAVGPQSIDRILHSCDGFARRRILDNIAVGDQTLAERLGRCEPNFDDLVRCDDGLLAEVFNLADTEVIQIALLGTPGTIIERFFRCMAPAEARQIRRRLAQPGPIRLSDVEEARRELAVLADSLSHGALEKTAA